MSKKIFIEGVIGYETDNQSIRDQLEAAKGDDVVAEIASPGGLISEGLKIYNTLKNYEGRVDTHLTGSVASMATYIAMVGEKRTAEKNAVFMIHNGRALAIGDHNTMFKVGRTLDSLSNMVAKEYSAKSGIPLKDIRSAMDDETYYYGDEIKDAGWVHEMVGDDDPEGREEAVSMATLLIEECQEKINNPESIRQDLSALASMLETEAPNGADNKTHEKGDDFMEITIEKLEKDAPELLAQIRAEARAAGQDEGRQEGIDQERARVAELMAVEDADPEARTKAITEGLAVDAAYKLFYEAEKKKKDDALAELEEETPDTVGQSGKDSDKDDKETFMDAVNAHQKEHGCTRTEALKAVAKARPALHTAYIEGK